MATLKARGAHEVGHATIERPKEERAHPYKEGWVEIRWSKRFRAIRSDGKILEKVQSYERDRAPDGTESRGYCPSAAYKITGTLKAGITGAQWAAMYREKGWTVEILAPFPSEKSPVATPTGPSQEPVLESVQASYAKHAPLDRGFNGSNPGAVPEGPWKSDWVDSQGRIQSTTGGGLDGGLGGATYPKGLSPGIFYPAMTYLTGTQSPAPGKRYGAPATHTQLYPVALKLFEDPEGMRACWLYDGNKWSAAFTPRCPEMDPAHCYMDNPAKRLRALLARVAGPGAECHDDGARFYAQADMPTTQTPVPPMDA